MLVYLCRHAAAAPGEPDELRQLTQEGVDQARHLGERLAAAVNPPAVVVASPLVRARQTAELIANATGAGLLSDERLAPGATLDGLRALIADLRGPVATVGHQPDCSEIARAVTGSDPGFAPAAVHPIELAP